jgi:hypothetical protein
MNMKLVSGENLCVQFHDGRWKMEWKIRVKMRTQEEAKTHFYNKHTLLIINSLPQ